MRAIESVVVVGASLAGLSSAHALRRFGFTGRVTMVGAEARRPYQRPPLSKQFLAGEFSAERCDLRIDDDLGAEWRLGTSVSRLDMERREIELDGGERLGFDGLVIATGARARRLPALDGIDDVFALRTIDDSIAIRDRLARGVRHVAIVGAGFIGCEVAATLRKGGFDVTVLDVDAYPMQRVLGPTLGALALALHRDHGVRMEMNVAVADIRSISGVKRLILADARTIDADIVIVGVGAEPVVDWLEGSGIPIDSGVVCDADCSVRGTGGIVAAGDVARWYNPLFETMMRVEHWDNAIAQGDAAARTLLAAPGQGSAYASVPLFWSDQYDVKLQMLGAPRDGDELHLVEGAMDARRFVAVFVREGCIVGAYLQNSVHRIVVYKSMIENRRRFADLPAAAAAAR